MKILLNVFVDILGGIGAVLLVIGMFYGVGWLLALMSKLSGKTFVRHGEVLYTPDDFDNLSKLPKELALKLKKSVGTVPNRMQELQKILQGNKAVDKIKALKDLTELYEKGTINEKEFEILKRQVLS